jgi:hypothetical protein
MNTLCIDDTVAGNIFTPLSTLHFNNNRPLVVTLRAAARRISLLRNAVSLFIAVAWRFAATCRCAARYRCFATLSTFFASRQ